MQKEPKIELKQGGEDQNKNEKSPEQKRSKTEKMIEESFSIAGKEFTDKLRSFIDPDTGVMDFKGAYDFVESLVFNYPRNLNRLSGYSSEKYLKNDNKEWNNKEMFENFLDILAVRAFQETGQHLKTKDSL